MKTDIYGHLAVTVVDGTTLTGLFAADGSLNVFDATSSSGYVGLMHPCGAINCTSVTGTTLVGRQNANGSLNIVNDSAQTGLIHPCGAMNITNFTINLASNLLNAYGPYGMVIDFADQSIAINDNITPANNFSSKGNISSSSFIGPAAKLTYTAPSPKMLEQADGFQRYQAHNLYLNSAAPANQSITVQSGASYTLTLTGTVSITLSGATTGTVTAGSTVFTAATGTLTCGSTSGSGTVHLRLTLSNTDYIATTSTALYAPPYRYSGGVCQGIDIEPQATNLAPFSKVLSSLNAQLNNTVTDNASADVSGNATADKYQRTAAQSYRGYSQVKAASALPYCFSVVVEKSVGDYVCVLMQGALSSDRCRSTFNLTTGTVSQAASSLGGFTGATSGIIPLPGGKYRVWLSVTSDASTSISFFVCPASSNIVSIDNSDTDTVAAAYFSDFQLENNLGPPTSIIPTYGAAVVRAADQETLLNALFPYGGNTEGTYFTEFTLGSITGTQNIIAANLNGRGVFSNGSQLATYDGTTSVAAGAPSLGVKTRVASSYGPAGLLICKDGGAITTGAYDGTWGGSPNNTQIGWASGSLIGFVSLHRVGYFPVQKTGDALQAIGA